MIVFVHSLGSWWERKDRRSDGGCPIWNGTGINDGVRIRPRSSVFGQISFGRGARLELAQHGRVRPAAWVASELAERNGIRQLQLIARAGATRSVDWHLITITEALVGRLALDRIAAPDVGVVAQSTHKSRQETMLLVRPHATIHGDAGLATFIARGAGSYWEITRWSSAA